MVNLRQASIDIIKAGQASSGAYVASPTFSQYGYSWLRDGMWIAYAMDTVGEHASASAFHRWAADTVRRCEPQIERLLAKLARGEPLQETDYLPTRFALDGEPGAEEWPDFQLDGYGAWLWGLVHHCEHHEPALWPEVRPAVKSLVAYLAALWRSPNYDCWEEFRDKVHVATLAALYGGLAAVQRHDPDLIRADLPAAIRTFTLAQGLTAAGHFRKFLGTDLVDASLLWVAVPYGLVDVDDSRFVRTLAQIERDLHRPGGGVYRYREDTYYGGGEWLLLAAWLAWVYLEHDRPEPAAALLRWVEAQARPDGEMPEQVCDHALHPEAYDGWVARWGEVACPLLWSHAMYLIVQKMAERKTR